MKKIEAYIKSEKLLQVVDSLKKVGIGGLTVSDVRGRGKAPRPIVGGLKGTARFYATFNSKNAIVIIVDDSKVPQVISTIIESAGTNSKGDGKIIVTPIEEIIDIGSKQGGASAL